MIMDAKKILKEHGQALIEFILFVPFMLMMYFTILAISNSINASINQQKITRSYFYYRAANNSMIPRPRRVDGDQEPSDSWGTFGMQIMGWADRFENNITPVAPCFKFKLPFGQSDDDQCGKSYTEKKTQFIRVQTVYGICGATYTNQNSENKLRHPLGANPASVSDGGACLITE